ncbi:hypothetical protein ACIBF1_44340 [Spirillospora sp. NPDC050679]
MATTTADSARNTSATDNTTKRGSSSLERVTVNLTARSSRALEQTVQSTGDSKTDAINRAVQISAYVEEVLANGGAIYVKDGPDGELERLKVF